MSDKGMLGKPPTIEIENRHVSGAVVSVLEDGMKEVVIHLLYPVDTPLPDFMGGSIVSDLLKGTAGKQVLMGNDIAWELAETDRASKAARYDALRALVDGNNVLSIINPASEMITSLQRYSPYSEYVVDTWHVRDGDPRKAEQVAKEAAFDKALDKQIEMAQQLAALGALIEKEEGEASE